MVKLSRGKGEARDAPSMVHVMEKRRHFMGTSCGASPSLPESHAVDRGVIERALYRYRGRAPPSPCRAPRSPSQADGQVGTVLHSSSPRFPVSHPSVRPSIGRTRTPSRRFSGSKLDFAPTDRPTESPWAGARRRRRRCRRVELGIGKRHGETAWTWSRVAWLAPLRRPG